MLFSHQTPYRPEDSGINPRPKAEGRFLFSRDDVGLDMKITMSLSLIYYNNI